MDARRRVPLTCITRITPNKFFDLLVKDNMSESQPLLKSRQKSQTSIRTRSKMPKQQDAENPQKKKVLVVGAGAAGKLKIHVIWT